MYNTINSYLFTISIRYDILALHDRILDLEADVYSNEEILYKDYDAMTDYEKEEYKIIKEMEKEYIRYSKIYGLLNDILEQC